VSTRTCDIVTSYERETVLNLVSWRETVPVFDECARYHGSTILGSFLHEENYKPTPLHEVGTWRRPLDPIPTVRVRLLDSSIQVFSATFGLQDPHTQSDALRMLESLYISTQTEKSSRFNVNATLMTDSQGKVRVSLLFFVPCDQLTNTLAVTDYLCPLATRRRCNYIQCDCCCIGLSSSNTFT
jgi:hypothetical protein